MTKYSPEKKEKTNKQKRPFRLIFHCDPQDSSGQEFTVVLLDSEGIDAAASDGYDDNQIFTLTVLLASVLIYNSQGVPTRHDLEGLEYPCAVCNA